MLDSSIWILERQGILASQKLPKQRQEKHLESATDMEITKSSAVSLIEITMTISADKH